MTGAMPSGRSLARDVLVRVWEDDAFASVALDHALRSLPRQNGAGAEAGLATDLVYGVLRTQRVLDTRLLRYAHEGRLPTELPTLAALRIGAYGLMFQSNVPAHAAVSTAVDLAHEALRPLVNALLRGLATELQPARDGQAPAPQLATAIVEAVPPHLMGALRGSLGRAEAKAFVRAGAETPPLGLACRAAVERLGLVERLRAQLPEEARCEAGMHSPHAVLLWRAGDPRALRGHGEEWIAQEEGAQLVALSVDARPGERVLDACAGRGTKAWLLHSQVGPSGKVDVAERYPAKLEALVASPIGPLVAGRYAVDWTVGTGDVAHGHYDHVLVDAPCSGVGTLRRRPEIMRRWDPSAQDVGLRAQDAQANRLPTEELAELQWRILRNAAVTAREGGHLVYAVCSVLREEAEAVVARLVSEGDAHGRLWEAVHFSAEPVCAIFAETASWRLLPHVHGTDGYFAARLRCMGRASSASPDSASR